MFENKYTVGLKSGYKYMTKSKAENCKQLYCELQKQDIVEYKELCFPSTEISYIKIYDKSDFQGLSMSLSTKSSSFGAIF